MAGQNSLPPRRLKDFQPLCCSRKRVPGLMMSDNYCLFDDLMGLITLESAKRWPVFI